MDEHTFGREPVTIVEIDQDVCTLTYGEAPCTAALDVTGDFKCFNTRATCQDPENYTRGVKTVRFCRAGQTLPDVPCIPMISSVTTAPTEINPGGTRDTGALGRRARVTVTFRDAPHSDIGQDPYVAEREYDPMERGTFWTKWLARNPYYNNRVLRVREGYVGQDLADMVTRTYIIDTITGPDPRGVVKVVARDILAFADNKKAQAPRPSTGELATDIDELATTIDVEGDAAEYPSSGTIRINDELITYTAKTIITGGVRFTGVTRHTDGSEPDSHQEGDRVQLCLRYTNVRVDALAREWLVDYGGVPSEFIPWTDWQDEADIWLDQFDLTGLVTEPTGVRDLLAEITEQCLFYIWWDERLQEIRLQAIKPPATDAEVPSIDAERNILADTAELSADPGARISQLLVYWGPRNAAERLDKEANYRHIYARVDEDAESTNEYGERVIKKIFSRWLHTDGQAINVGVRLLGRYRDNARYLDVSLDAKDRALWTGDIVDVTCRQVVDATGLPQAQRWQIVAAEEEQPGHSVSYRLLAYEYQIGARFGRWMDSDAPVYADAGEEARSTGMWWADEDGRVDGDLGYSWI